MSVPTTTTFLDLLRHGETEGGARYRGTTDDPLTAAGRQQMWAAVKNDVHWDGVVSSPLTRCAEFARALARQRALPLALDERLAEMHFGAWEGRSAAELMETDAEALGRFWANPSHNPPPGGEPLAQFQARVLDSLNDIINEHTGQHVLVVTHGGVIRVLRCHVQQRPAGELLALAVEPGTLHRIRVSRANGQARATFISEAWS